MDALRGPARADTDNLFNKHEINEIRAGSCIKEAWVSLLPDEMPSEPVEEDGLNEPDEEDELIHGRKCFTCLNAPASTRLGCGHSCFCTNCLGKYVCSPIPDFICPFCRVKVSVGQCSMGVQVPFENAFVEPVNGGHIDDGDDSGVGRRHRHEVALLKQSRDRALIRSDYLSELLRSSSETEAHVERRHERKVFQLEQERDTARRDRDALHAQVEAMARVERRHQREVAQREQDVDDAHRGRELLQVEVGTLHEQAETGRLWQALAHTGRLWYALVHTGRLW
jgi:hypothetical protein